jgi:hypothetical protein
LIRRWPSTGRKSSRRLAEWATSSILDSDTILASIPFLTSSSLKVATTPPGLPSNKKNTDNSSPAYDKYSKLQSDKL